MSKRPFNNSDRHKTPREEDSGYQKRKRRDDKNKKVAKVLSKSKPVNEYFPHAVNSFEDNLDKQDINEEPPIEEVNDDELICEELVNFQEAEPNVQALQDHTTTTCNAEFDIGKWPKKVSDTEKDFWIKNGEPIERFFGMMPNTGHKAEQMFTAVKEYLDSHRVDIKNCRGQSHDNAAVMSGINRGFQKLIRDENPLAFYIPCFSHSLNLVETDLYLLPIGDIRHYSEQLVDLYNQDLEKNLTNELIQFRELAKELNIRVNAGDEENAQQKHMQISFEAKLYKLLCDNGLHGSFPNKFSKKNYLKFHIDAAHNKITCSYHECGKVFKRKDYLKTHVDTEHNKTTHTCDICRKKFSNTSNLRKHINAVHNGIKYTCDMCRKSFSQKSYLKTHVDAVHNKIPYSCDECGKKFSRKGTLKIHIDSIHNKISYSCDECRKKFKTKVYLKTHVDSVHNKTTHTCDICRKKFSMKSSLRNIHIKTKHSCSVCEKTFTQKDNLKTHIEKVHNFNYKNNRYA
uniref:C2H2-type domain-containing protein n=1 Tax=Trichogramma kaykai TaxID=54128 RepID=A0ABD2X9B4_9HYME